MSLSRRKMLALVGGGVVLAAGSAGAGFALTRTPHRALAPWAAAGGYADPRLNALSFAILAPNPHNLQPWEAELLGTDRVRIFRNPGQTLPHTDPYDRQLTIGMGCFLELMAIAASADGQAVEIALFPEGDAPDAPVAEVTFRAGDVRADPLGAAILDRRSCKEPFLDQPVAATDVQALEPLAQIITDPARVAELRELTWAAHLVEVTTPHTLGESVDVMRLGRREIEAKPYGIDLGGPLLEGLMLAGLLTRESLRDMDSTGFRQSLEIYRTMLHATPAYAVITTQGNSREDQIGAGRDYMRLNLATTQLGLALHPVSQALQEYPEMAEHYAHAQGLLGGPGATVQMLARLGHGPKVAQSPRWPLEAKLRAG